MAWLQSIRRTSAPRAELAAATAPPLPTPAVAWGALLPEGATAAGLLAEQYPLVARTVHVGRTVNPLCALCLPLPQGAPPKPPNRVCYGSRPWRPHRAPRGASAALTPPRAPWQSPAATCRSSALVLALIY
jgi:hypothetical protein